MHRNIKRRLYFVSSSLMWAVLLFSIMMIVLNWNDMHNISGRYVIISSQTDTIIHKVGPSALDAVQSLFSKKAGILNLIK